VPSMLKNKQNH